MTGTRHILLEMSVIILLTAVCTPVFADNPLIYQRYTADPNASMYNGRMYLYCSHDQDDAVAYDSITDLSLISSDDLVNWTDHGEPVQMPRDASWASMAWAPASVYRNGYYYVYFGNGANNIGVLRSTSPTGPFTDPIGGALITRSMPNCNVDWLFDPGVFIDDDGQAYLYFGGGGEGNARVIRLNNDMISVNGDAVSIDVPRFFEALFMHKRNGIYYLSYSSDFSLASARIEYMTSSNPMTGFVYRGVILDNPSDNCYNNNHTSIVNIGDDWYIAYHTRRLANLNGIDCATSIYQRSTALNRLYYNGDGTIQKVTPNTAGVAQLKNVNPYVQNEAETMDISSGIETETCSEGGRNVGFIENGDWIRVTGVDFGSGAASFEARIASAGSGGSIEIRTGSPTGTLAGTCAVPVTGGWQTWQSVNCAVSGLTGVQNLYLRFTGTTGYLFNFNSYRFYQTGAATPTPVATTVPTNTPVVTGALRSLAAAKNMLIGAEAASNPLHNETIYRDILAREFNWMGGENEFKAYLWSGPYTYNFTTTDYYRAFRDANNMLMRGHVLVYYTVVPSWMSSGSYTNAQVSDMLREYIYAMAGRYSGKMNEWDVVNEAVTDGAPYGYRTNDFWHQKLGDYIPQAFSWARQADPQAKLFYNDYGNEGLNGKSNYIYSMVSGFKSSGVPIDGVGWQCHVSSSWRLNDDIWENAQRLTALGLQVTVTELDIAIPVPVDAAKLQSQAKAYADMTFLCMTHPNIKRMFLWGFTDKHSWIPGFTDGASDAALIYDTNYVEKPAYHAIQTVLGLQPVNGIYNGGYESSVFCWNEMSGGTIAEETTVVHSGVKSARVYNRSQVYHGIGQYVLPYLLEQGQGNYNASVWARLASGTDNVRLTLYVKDDSGARYISLGSAAATSTAWTQVSGSANVTWTGLLRVARLFVETQNTTSTFYVDDAAFSRQVSGTPTRTPTLAPTFTRTFTATPSATLTPTGTPVVSSSWRVIAGSAVSYTDSQGFTWAADTNYSGGTPYSTTQTVTAALPGASDQPLYQSERYGNPFTYSFDVPAGSYQVTLKFAETYFTAAGSRSFNISINGAQVIANFDILTAAGGANTAIDRVFNNIAPSGGRITIDFGPAATDNAKVCAIQIIPQPATPTPTRTSTAASTFTMSPTRSATLTATRTGTPTAANSPTSTNTPGATASGTAANTVVITATNTVVLTATATPTDEPFITATYTQTATAVATQEPTPSETAVIPATPTVTETLLPAASATQTSSLTPLDTATTIPNTMTATMTNTILATLTPTMTNTVPPTGTPTVFIPTGTSTLTGTMTVTQTRTRTHTPTVTRTPVPAATPTLTPVPDAAKLIINSAVFSPNPVKPETVSSITIDYRLSRQCISAEYRIYSTAFRKVCVAELPGPHSAGENRVSVPAGCLKGLSAGIYYAVIEAKDAKGAAARSKPQVLVIIR